MNKRPKLLLLVFLLAFSLVRAQDTSKLRGKNDSAYIDLDNSGDRDIIDVLHHIMNRHDHPHAIAPVKKTDRYHLSLVPAAGYTLQTGWAGIVSANLAFYRTDSDRAKISSISTSITYSQYSQIILPVQADLWTKGNKFNVITDFRYLQYPSTTFGLGGHTVYTDGYTIDFSYIKLHQSVLKAISKDLYAGLGYYLDYAWNIREVNPPVGEVTSFQKYGLTTTELASGIALRLLYDSRLNQINPNNGFYANIVYRPNFTFMGSDNNWQSLLLEFRKYVKFPHSENVLAFWSYNWLTTGGRPGYLFLPSTGWDDSYNTGRGYIQGRFRGNNMTYLEAEYRFKISQNGLFGGVLYGNAQSFSKEISDQYNTITPGWGTGLRIKLNKYSKANLCIDYGFGLEGSKGFFVNLGEVF